VDYFITYKQWYIESSYEHVLFAQATLPQDIASIVLKMLPFGRRNAVVFDELACYSLVLFNFLDELLRRLNVLKRTVIDHR